jgi:hypothetical protein
MPFRVIEFVLSHGVPLSTVDWFRSNVAGCECLPDPSTFRGLLLLVKDEVEQSLVMKCDASPYIAFAMDGWTDSRGRRFQGVTVRLFNPSTFSAETHVLAMKEVKTIHESGRELALILSHLVESYRGRATPLNVCTDRGSINIAAFRRQERTLRDTFDEPHLWLPCTCHILNNILSEFMHHISHISTPIFRIQHRFRKCGPFLAYLSEQGSSKTSISSISEVRWYSSNQLLSDLLTLWPHMQGFLEREHLVMPDLSDEVKDNIQRLHKLTDLFTQAQHQLESDAFGVGSLFIPWFLSIRAAIQELADIAWDAVEEILAYMNRLEQEYRLEWDVFTMMTFLNPSQQWIEERTCSAERFERITDALISWVGQEMAEAMQTGPCEMPAANDFFRYFSRGPADMLPPDEQFRLYLERRTTGEPAEMVPFWLHPPPTCRHLARVAAKVLFLLATSASVERVFSGARQVTGDFQMSMKPETIAARVMIRSNWKIASGCLLRILALGQPGWAEHLRARQDAKTARDDPSRFLLLGGEVFEVVGCDR